MPDSIFYKAPRCHGDGHFESAGNFIIVITSTGKKSHSTWAEMFLNKTFGRFHQHCVGFHSAWSWQVCSGCLDFMFFLLLGIGIKVGNRTGLNYWVFVVMGIFLARCMSDEWGGNEQFPLF